MKNAFVRTIGLSLALAFAVTAGAQDKAQPDAKKAPPMDPKQQAMMEAWQKAATPGPQHKELAAMAGNWDVTIKSFEGPQPQVTTGKAVRKMILGGRFLQEDYSGTYMGQPFQGFGLTGYDNVLKQYTLFWVDSMGTAMMVGEGHMDASGKVLTSTMTYTDPMTAKRAPMRQVMKEEGADTEIFEMYGPGPDGKEMKMLEMTYKRAK
jgi:hypothetical protein